MEPAPKTRQCSRCPAVLPESEFPLTRARGKTYRRSWCPACLARYLREERPDRNRTPRKRPRPAQRLTREKAPEAPASKEQARLTRLALLKERAGVLAKQRAANERAELAGNL
jgi:hypothetical protein